MIGALGQLLLAFLQTSSNYTVLAHHAPLACTRDNLTALEKADACTCPG